MSFLWTLRPNSHCRSVMDWNDSGVGTAVRPVRFVPNADSLSVFSSGRDISSLTKKSQHFKTCALFLIVIFNFAHTRKRNKTCYCTENNSISLSLFCRVKSCTLGSARCRLHFQLCPHETEKEKTGYSTENDSISLSLFHYRVKSSILGSARLCRLILTVKSHTKVWAFSVPVITSSISFSLAPSSLLLS